PWENHETAAKRAEDSPGNVDAIGAARAIRIARRKSIDEKWREKPQRRAERSDRACGAEHSPLPFARDREGRVGKGERQEREHTHHVHGSGAVLVFVRTGTTVVDIRASPRCSQVRCED